LEVKNAEEALLTSTSARLEIQSSGGSSGFFTTVTEVQLQEVYRKLFENIFTLIQNVLKDAQLDKGFIDGIILIGDPSNVAKIQPFIKEYFAGTKLHSGLKSDEVIVKGVAAQAGVLGNTMWDDWGCPPLMDVAPLSLGIETAGGFFTKIVPRNTVILIRKSRIFNRS
jgi:heat shock protein 1/8